MRLHVWFIAMVPVQTVNAKAAQIYTYRSSPAETELLSPSSSSALATISCSLAWLWQPESRYRYPVEQLKTFAIPGETECSIALSTRSIRELITQWQPAPHSLRQLVAQGVMSNKHLWISSSRPLYLTISRQPQLHHHKHQESHCCRMLCRRLRRHRVHLICSICEVSAEYFSWEVFPRILDPRRDSTEGILFAASCRCHGGIVLYQPLSVELGITVLERLVDSASQRL